MSRFQSLGWSKRSRRLGVGLAALTIGLIGLASPASAEHNPGWGQWWLPPVHSEHGPAVDQLFYWIFWITMITFVLVEAMLVIFLIKYRNRPEKKKAHFTHGNTRLEMAWTIAPAIILAALALGSKAVWDNYRYSPSADDPNRAKVLVIGQQFKWNFIWPGPDGKLGKYLLYPKPTDAKWPVGPDGKDFTFADVPGPASLTYKDAVKAINDYIDQVNPLGKDFSDPDGKDDDWVKEAGGRPLILPAHRPIEVQLSSKDVIHDFYLPNFRVKLDAVPGMRGVLYFTSTMTSAERRKAGVKTLPIAQVAALSKSVMESSSIIIDETAPGSEANKDQNRPRPGVPATWRYFGGENKTTITRNGAPLTPDIVDQLKAAGLTEIKLNIVEDDGNWELVCEELCGQGHNTMTAVVTFLPPDEYDKLNLDKPYKAPAAAPTASAAQ